MIAVDSSAVVAIYAGEPDAAALSRAIVNDAQPVISAATLVETIIVLRTLTTPRDRFPDEWLDQFLSEGKFRIEPVTEEIAAIARTAHLRYGKGMGHPAQLNFGDCFSYALAKALGAPLLYKGGDFARTDIGSAL